MKVAAKRGEDPGSPAVQDLARRWMELVNEFTQGDPEIIKGLSGVRADPQMPYQQPYSDEENEYIQRALEIHKGR